MNSNDKDRRNQADHSDRQTGFDKDQPSEVAGQPIHDASRADDRGQGLRRKPQGDDATIPELEEPGGGEERDKHTEATMPPGEGTNPKRNTM
jgi:hypothetical protein